MKLFFPTGSSLVLEIEARAMCILSLLSSTELHPQCLFARF